MDKKIIDKLEREFEKKDIKKRPGPGGMKLSYIEGSKVIRRLNEAFDHEWTFRVTQTQVVSNHAIVTVAISKDGNTKEGIGGKKIGADVENAFKAATTDALKVAARLFGIGLHLYEDESTPVAKKKEPEVDEGGPALESQRTAIETLCRSKQINGKEFFKAEGVDWKGLSISQAKSLIVKLNAMD